MQNTQFTELLGSDFSNFNYAVTTNWRIDFSQSPEFKKLIGGGTGIGGKPLVDQMSFAFHSDVDFTGSIVYAEAKVKGIPIRQAAWQDREIKDVPCAVYESMSHALYKALERATNKIAGFYDHRNIAPKEAYTFSGIMLYAFGNADANGDLDPICTYELLGAQLNSFKSPTYTSEAANIADVTFNLYAHGFKIA